MGGRTRFSDGGKRWFVRMPSSWIAPQFNHRDPWKPDRDPPEDWAGVHGPTGHHSVGRSSSRLLHMHWRMGLWGTSVHPCRGRELGWAQPLHTCDATGT